MLISSETSLYDNSSLKSLMNNAGCQFELYRPTTCMKRVISVFTLSAIISCLYAGVFILGSGKKKKSGNFQELLNTRSRVNSSLNAILVFVLASMSFFKDGSRLLDNPLHTYSNYVFITSCCLFAYTLVDSAVVLVLLRNCKSEQRLEHYCYLAHHILTIYMAMIVSIYDYLPFFAGLRLLSEFSTPFINIRWYALKSGLYDTLAFYILHSLTFIAFCLCRLLPIIPFWLWLFQAVAVRSIPTSGLNVVDRFVRVVNSATRDNQIKPYMKLHFEIMVVCCLTLDVLNCIWAARLFNLTYLYWKKQINQIMKKQN
ncbi:hypothetical protein GJ496_002934 [Pomphorhynchus laevis]|nr:hypothetical protein GJ496_002934 [Pomphorhynchus laevis]